MAYTVKGKGKVIARKRRHQRVRQKVTEPLRALVWL